MTTNTNLLILFLIPCFLHPSLSSRTSSILLGSSSPPPSPTSPPPSPPSPQSIKTFNVKDFGAKNDSNTISTKAFLDAWNSACAFGGPSKIYVPNGKYLLQPLIFEGISCKNKNILFQIDGILAAPNDYREVAKFTSWIVFHQVDGLQIKGGVLDAKGKSLWNCKVAKKQCPIGAKSLSIDNSRNTLIDGLRSINSQMFHITINACKNIKMINLKVEAESKSPNTDGIHIEKSSGITIMNSDFKTGDDCISIGPYNQHLWIEHVNCGPGHGISIGSLGRGSDEGVVVRNVTVKSTTFTGTENGFRIKTFSEPINGKVHDVFFMGARMNNVQNPIIIDQKYCTFTQCQHHQGSGIQINNIKYKGIHGTSTSKTGFTFYCSSKKPCVGLTLDDIQLSYQSKTTQCLSENAYGKVLGFMLPSNCLKS